MSRRLLLGRAGTGKTHACLDLLVETLAGGGEALLLVPTYSQAEHLLYVLVDRPVGLSTRTVRTFEQLAEEHAGVRLAELAPAPVRDRFAARALRDVFPEAWRRPGLRAEFLAAVKEIKEQGADPALTLAQARAHFPEGARGRKLFDAYARYAALLPGTDHEDLLLRARDRLREKAPALARLLVDGFHDFTPVQREILDLLAAGARETVVTLPLDPDDRTHPIFATAARTARAFEGYREEPLRGNRRAAPGLAALEERLFRDGDAGEGAGIEVLVCPSEEDEADRLARLVAASGRPYDDFLLVRRAFGDLHPLYRAAFRRHGVPLRFYEPETFGRTAAARAASLWLRTVAAPVDPQELLPLLRSPYFLARPPAAEVDALAAALRERRTPEAPACVRPRAEGSLAALLAAELGVADALVLCPDGDEEIGRAARLFALLAAEAEAVADLSLAEAADALLRRLPLLRAAARDRRHDCVYAVDAADARQWEKPVVLVAGLTADAFPRQVRQDLFLRDDERRELGEARGLHLPLRARREDEERYLFYVALTRARERLVLSYNAYDEQGVRRAPSPYLAEALARVRPERTREIPLAEQVARPEDAVARGDLLPLVADGLVHGQPLATSLYGLGAVDRAELARPRRLEVARLLPVAGAGEGPVRLSASSMNRYLRCPYLFLLDKVLHVQRPRKRELDPMERGNIAHEALERIARGKEDPDRVFDEIFLEKTRGFRLGLEDEAHRRWMRAAVLKAARELDDAPVEEVERTFTLELGDATLTGRIDRIDRFPAGRLVRDYKTGRADLAEARDLRNVQLDAYLLAVEDPAGAVFERLRKGDAAGFVLQELAGEVAGDLEVLSRAQLAERLVRMRELVARVAAEVRAGRLAVRPREPEDCTRTKCDGYDLCRVHRGRWLAKAARAAKEEDA